MPGLIFCNSDKNSLQVINMFYHICAGNGIRLFVYKIRLQDSTPPAINPAGNMFIFKASWRKLLKNVHQYQKDKPF